MPLSNCVNLLGRGTKVVGGSTPGVGNVVGPASATLNAVARYADTTGKVIKDSNVTLADSGTALVFSGAGGLTASGSNNSITLTPSGTGSVQTIAGTVGNPSYSFAVDATKGFYSSASNQIGVSLSGALSLSLAANGQLIGAQSGNYIQLNSSGAATLVASGSNQAVTLSPSGSGGVTISTKIGSYNAISTQGMGVGAIYGYTEVTAQSAAGNIATYTVGAADGVFRVSADMSVTAATVLSTTLTVTYTDKSNTARTMILPVQQLSGSFIAGGLITATGAWETPTMQIRCKASTSITILSSAGTFNTVVFSASGTIEQVA